MRAILRDTSVTTVRTWFALTVDLLSRPPGQLLGAFAEGRVVGVLVASNTRGAPFAGQVRWLWRAVLALGPAIAWRTVAHDRRRAATFPDGEAAVVEFVAVDPAMRGQGVARRLFDTLHRGAGAVWLETTRTENLTIFARLGYRRVESREEGGVTYHAMLRGGES